MTLEEMKATMGDGVKEIVDLVGDDRDLAVQLIARQPLDYRARRRDHRARDHRDAQIQQPAGAAIPQKATERDGSQTRLGKERAAP